MYNALHQQNAFGPSTVKSSREKKTRIRMRIHYTTERQNLWNKIEIVELSVQNRCMHIAQCTHYVYTLISHTLADFEIVMDWENHREGRKQQQQQPSWRIREQTFQGGKMRTRKN